MKKIIAGFIAGMIFATAGTALAQTAIEKITASVRTDYSVEVDGKKVTLTNSPLAYNGSSYLPVREVSEMLGKEVDFKDGVIKLTTPEIKFNIKIPDGLTPQEYYNKLIAEKEKLVEELNETKATYEESKNDPRFTEKDDELAVIFFKNSEERIEGIDKMISYLLEQYPQLSKK
ncbi:stalk domain-containing protein [Paenibacillus paeoniae]|uniref:Copper amine oxidase-like N-terminal domain-containing protein n=1 Tax=Paenibacillus paeoniae TaxID=2292705 RepID=A0A371P180_9BACL|nr:stalk domain-containing protein [Paenibacillus paeoniae]REK69348.1 hypothetical protein DX130_24620 [Paenibacillus paeoniae]